MRNISFEIATIIISLLMLTQFYRIKKIPLFQNKLFSLLVQFNMYSALSGMIYDIMLCCCDGFVPYWVGMLTNTVYFVTHLLCMPLILLYMMSIITSWRDKKIWIKLTCTIPAAIGVIFIIVNIFTGIIFFFNENGVYQRGSAIAIVYAVAGYYLVYLMIYTVKYRRFYSKIRLAAVSSAIIFSAFSVLIQYLFPNELVETCAIAISELILFFSVQNPRSMFDTASGAYNRSAFASTIETYFRSGKHFDIAVIYLDDLDIVERTFGSRQCDAAVSEIRQYISEKLNSRIYRTETDVFCVELPENQYTAWTEIYERFKKPWSFAECETLLSTKICIISCPEDAPSIEMLHEVTDWFKHDHSGKKIMQASELDYSKIERKKLLEKSLDKALDNDEIGLLFSPVSSMQNRICAAEVTLFYVDDDIGIVSQNELVPVAQSNGKMNEVFKSALEKLCKMISENDTDTTDCYIIELAAEECTEVNADKAIISMLDKYKIPHSKIVASVSEYTISKAAAEVEKVLMGLYAAGVRLCLKNYGSGYTNIACIYSLPFELICISKKVIKSAMNAEKAKITLESTMSLIHELGMKTLADGVENESCYNAVSSVLCDYMQGRYISKPLERSEFLALVENRSIKEGVQ